MYDFKQHLDKNEKILYNGNPVPGKGGKGLFGGVFILALMLATQIGMIWSLSTGNSDFLSIIVIFIFTIGIEIWAIYHLIYSLFFKKKEVSDDCYCITDKRVFKYEFKKNKLVYGYLINYDEILCYNIKNNFGDVSFERIITADNLESQDPKYVKDLLLNPNPENMTKILFESIENPKEILKIATSAREKLLEDKD